MFLNCYRLGVGLTTLVVFALILPAAFGQVVEMPTILANNGRHRRHADPQRQRRLYGRHVCNCRHA